MTRRAVFPSGSHPDVVEEHLEEAAFLYVQRQHLARTGRATWGRLRSIEGRFEAHLEGLIVAGAEAWPLIRPAVEDEVAGAAHVAVRLLCRAGDAEGALALAAAPDAAHVGEAVDALVHEAPPNWTDRLAAELEADDPRRVRVAAAVVGASRRPAGVALMRALARAGEPETEATLVRALGALRYPPARGVLARGYRASAHPSVARATRAALLRFGDSGTVRDATERAREHPRNALSLALAGDERHGPLLAEAARAGNPGAPVAPVALGVLGDPAHVPLLLDLLDSPDTAAEAALGLRVLTGAPLVEEALVLDDPDDPEVGGDLVVRPSRRPADWRAWWAEHGGAFRPGVRVRAGRPFTPLGAVAAPVGGLGDDLLPATLRDGLADELAGRYGLDAPFRADAFVAHQRAALAALADAAADIRFREGEWETAGSRRLHRR